MTVEEHLPLWEKIQHFQFDEPNASVPFSAKLAASENWSAPFTERAMEEYRKFLLLCCILPEGAAPSQTIDAVWHLHLTYTQSYWMELCRDTLGKDIHHYPSAGGDAEDRKHQGWYADTLKSYRLVFGMDSPSDIWPPAIEQEPFPEEASLPVRESNAAIAAVLIALPFLYIGMLYQTLNPFMLTGPEFLGFLPLFALALVFSHVVYRSRVRKQVNAIVASRFPDDASPFQVAHFLYGKHRALQAGLVDLIKRNLLTLTPDNHFCITRGTFQSVSENGNPLTESHAATSDGNYRSNVAAAAGNPLVESYAAEPDGSLLTYDRIAANWYDKTKFAHPELDKLDHWVRREQPFLQLYLFPFLFYVVSIARMLQGFFNGRPISFLLLETVLLTIIFVVVFRQYSRSSQVATATRQLYLARLGNMESADARLLPAFALQGVTAINGFAEGVMLAGIFGAYDTTAYSSRWGAGGNSGSSCGSGSSCSGGSSCGGGSGCGGCSGS